MGTTVGLLGNPRTFQVAAAGQGVDAAICIQPIPHVAQCFDTVGFPRQHRWIFPVIKGASATGLAAAPRYPGLARLTAIAVTVYFALAVGAHVRVRDFRLNFASATSLLVFYGALAVVGPRRSRA